MRDTSVKPCVTVGLTALEQITLDDLVECEILRVEDEGRMDGYLVTLNSISKKIGDLK